MKRIVIENIKSIQSMCFDIPEPGLHIITGTNGSGKTTLFTCISRICNSNAYRLGFPAKSNKSYDLFSGKITYQFNDQEVTYSRRENGEWRPNAKSSTVLESFRYPQIINITTKDKRIFSQENITPRRRGSDVWLNKQLNTIFDTDKFSQMIKITTGDLRRGRGVEQDRRRNIAYAIPLGNNKYYTERSFSFGEIVLVNMLFDIQNVPNGSLILIDELELAIHPSSQIRLIQCLKSLAQERGLTILISTHSASIIKSQKNVIFLNTQTDGNVEIIYNCPPAKAIGAIGMREDTNPDIIILVEDSMAKSLFHALKQKYISLQNETSYLDIRILEIGGFSSVIHFFIETNNYIFYDNVYVAAFMDKDVETDIIPYPQYSNTELIQKYDDNSYYLRFLPYTPEVLLIKTFYNYKRDLLNYLKGLYDNQQLNYQTPECFDFAEYDQGFPNFTNQNEYNTYIEKRGTFRKKCKTEAERISKELSDQINQSTEEIYRAVFKFAVEAFVSNEINIRQLLSSTMKRLSH